MKKHTLFIILIIGIALAIGVWRENQGPTTMAVKKFDVAKPLAAGTALPSPKKLPEFDLKDMDGKPFNNASLEKHWSFVFFGYTSCPHICPTTLGSLHQLSQRLHGGSFLQFIFVTIDPESDSPARLKDYLHQDKFKGTPFKGVTGKKDHIQELAQTIGIFIDPNKKTDDNHIEHSGAILLINPEGKLAAVFTSPDKPAAIAHDFKEIMHRYAHGV